MPVYEYLCDKGHEFEAEQSIKADTLSSCRKQVGATDAGLVFCNAPCHRLIPNTSFKFKGGPPTPKYHT
jgi:predicted nucleic acid-binding Zn ribbon protein